MGTQLVPSICVHKHRDNHPIPDHPTFSDKFQPNEKKSSFYLIPKIFSDIFLSCLNIILTQQAKLWGNLSLTDIGGPPKQTTQADHFSQITQYRTMTGPLLDHLQPETCTETWFESCKYFLFLLKNQTLLFKKIIISGGPLAWCWNTVGLEKLSFFPLFHFPKKWKFTIFLMKIFYEHILQKIGNFVKLHFVLLFKKNMFPGCTIHLHPVVRWTGGQCFFLGWKWVFFQASGPHWKLHIFGKCG